MLIWLIAAIGIAFAVAAHAVFGGTSPPRSEGEAMAVATADSAIVPEAPHDLQAQLDQIAARAPGKSAILIRSVNERWVAGVRGATTFPQGSLRRIWLGAVLLEAVDFGEISLDQRVPLLASNSRKSSRTERVSVLFRKAVGEDDRAAQDEVLAGLMGPAGIKAWLERREFGEIAFGPSNKDLVRSNRGTKGQGALPDGATADGIAFAAGELFAGRVLKEDTAALLLAQFTPYPASERTTGSQVLQLTGTSPLVGPVASASGIALVRSRTGQRFVIVVFAADTARPERVRDGLLADAVAALKGY